MTKTLEMEINEYCDMLKDVKPHLDEAFENNLHLESVLLVVDHPEASNPKIQNRIKKIMKYCTAHDKSVEVEYK